MKPTAFAAMAALVAVARMAVAQTTGSGEPAAEPIVRAAAETHALVASMQNNTRIARDALELARSRKRHEEIRCADEALSRADVALRRAREDAAKLTSALGTHDVTAVRVTVGRIRMRAADSREAEVLALSCSSPPSARSGDRTLVTVRVDPVVARAAL